MACNIIFYPHLVQYIPHDNDWSEENSEFKFYGYNFKVFIIDLNLLFVVILVIKKNCESKIFDSDESIGF